MFMLGKREREREPEKQLKLDSIDEIEKPPAKKQKTENDSLDTKHVKAGNSLSNCGKYMQAIKSYDQALAINNQNSIAWYQKAESQEPL